MQDIRIDLQQEIQAAWNNGDKAKTAELLDIAIAEGSNDAIWMNYQLYKDEDRDKSLIYLERLHKDVKVWAELYDTYTYLKMGEARRVLTSEWIEAEPDNVSAISAWASELNTQQLYELADIQYERACTISHPVKKPVILYNWGCALMERSNYSEAHDLFKQSLKLGYSEAAWNLALCKLYMGNIDGLEGWSTRFLRTSPDSPKLPDIPLPYWNGRDLDVIKDKSVLVLNEQGFGDEFMFANSYEVFNSTKMTKIQVYEETLPALQKVLTFENKNIEFFTDRSLSIEWLKQFDYWTVSGEVWAGQLESGILPIKTNRLEWKKTELVGLVWEPNRKAANWEKRKFNPTQLDIDNYTVWSLNPACELPKEIKGVNKNPADWGETVEYLKEVDKLYTCDTGIAHLAILMGIRTVLVLGDNPDWRWNFYTPDRIPQLTFMRIDNN